MHIHGFSILIAWLIYTLMVIILGAVVAAIGFGFTIGFLEEYSSYIVGVIM